MFWLDPRSTDRRPHAAQPGRAAVLRKGSCGTSTWPGSTLATWPRWSRSRTRPSGVRSSSSGSPAQVERDGSRTSRSQSDASRTTAITNPHHGNQPIIWPQRGSSSPRRLTTINRNPTRLRASAPEATKVKPIATATTLARFEAPPAVPAPTSERDAQGDSSRARPGPTAGRISVIAPRLDDRTRQHRVVYGATP